MQLRRPTCPAPRWPCLSLRAAATAALLPQLPSCPTPTPARPQPLMRADFTLFDEYEHTHGDEPAFAFPLTTFWGSRDRRIKQHLVQASVRAWGRPAVEGMGGAQQWMGCGTALRSIIGVWHVKWQLTCAVTTHGHDSCAVTTHGHDSCAVPEARQPYVPGLPCAAGVSTLPCCVADPLPTLRDGAGSPPATSSCTRWRGTTCGRWKRPARLCGWAQSLHSWSSWRCERRRLQRLSETDEGAAGWHNLHCQLVPCSILRFQIPAWRLILQANLSGRPSARSAIVCTRRATYVQWPCLSHRSVITLCLRWCN